ncbi:MAG: hypothetical protein Q9166_004514 [cf. Caloplaca sp. 2 TL-2023]
MPDPTYDPVGHLGTWNFNPNGGGGATWTQKFGPRGAPWNRTITRPFGGAGQSTNNTGFLLGGYSSGKSSPLASDLTGFVATPGSLAYSFSNGTWANVTDMPNLTTSGAIEWASMKFVPLGPNGLMVVIGGETSDLTSYTPGAQERPMRQIMVFDPVTLRFYKQTAGGDKIPSPRTRCCIAGVGDSKKVGDKSLSSSYEISASDEPAAAAATQSGTASGDLSKYEKIGVGVGSVIGGIILLLLLGTLIFLHLHRHRRRGSHRTYTNRNELVAEGNKHELPPTSRIPPRNLAARRFLVELDAGEVAMEKGVGNATPGRSSPGLWSPVLVEKPQWDLSPTSSGTSASSPPLSKLENRIFSDLKPPDTAEAAC